MLTPSKERPQFTETRIPAPSPRTLRAKPYVKIPQQLIKALNADHQTLFSDVWDNLNKKEFLTSDSVRQIEHLFKDKENKKWFTSVLFCLQEAGALSESGINADDWSYLCNLKNLNKKTSIDSDDGSRKCINLEYLFKMLNKLKTQNKLTVLTIIKTWKKQSQNKQPLDNNESLYKMLDDPTQTKFFEEFVTLS
jgi:hypothetical protein